MLLAIPLPILEVIISDPALSGRVDQTAGNGD
jgi:hypothetical protein